MASRNNSVIGLKCVRVYLLWQPHAFARVVCVRVHVHMCPCRCHMRDYACWVNMDMHVYSGLHVHS